MTTRDHRQQLSLLVKQLTWEADGVLSVLLVDPDGKPLPPWQPGAHVDVTLGNGLVRQYSLCSDPDDRCAYRVAVLREQDSRGGSVYVHDRLRPGDTVTVAEPLNNFEVRSAEKYLFIAGGIGITPLLPMVRATAESGADWRLLYGGRRRASMAFLDELNRYGSRVDVVAEDERGMLDLDSWLTEPTSGMLVYCCGPEGLITAVEQRCEAWPTGTLQVERFSPKPQPVPDADAERGFEVVCRRSGITVQVPPTCTIMETLRAAGIDVPSSCEEGICGTCETAVIDGVPDHRDSILSDAERAENTTMMICVGRSLSDRLVLDR
ncbi:MAG: 2Fe-2S iron-sulfur cluster binding domain-containing protein [Actinophytocola sp.]|nr:2Fe-2S iron-sulfur cluster binding domain-containing protein [Actinophytocola sp.]